MNGSLFLYNSDPLAEPLPMTQLASALREIGLIAGPLGPGWDEFDFRAGEGFARHITFAGCSPFLQLEPSADGSAFCFIRLLGPFEHPQLFTSKQLSRPRCPACRTRVTDWQALLATGGKWRCGCGAKNGLLALDWRQHAAMGRQLVEVRNVFPGEAVPSDPLLHHLATTSGTLWRYAWADSTG